MADDKTYNVSASAVYSPKRISIENVKVLDPDALRLAQMGATDPSQVIYIR